MLHPHVTRSSLLLSLCLVLAACGGEPQGDAVELSFAARVGSEPFACGADFAGVGTTASTLAATDFRFYVSDVVLLSDAGEVPLTLTEDGVWQNGSVALLDFEDGCDSGNEDMNSVLRGTVPAGSGPFTGVRFTLGVPQSRNYLDSGSAPSPLNLTSMYWGWQGGYKFLRIDGRSTGQPGGLRLHLGSTECSGDAIAGTRVCASTNAPTVTLSGFDPATGTIVADLGALLATSDIDTDAGAAPGCMSDASDPECAPIFEALGLPFAGSPTPSAQSFFRAEAGR